MFVLKLGARALVVLAISSGAQAESLIPVPRDAFGCGPSDSIQVCAFSEGSFADLTPGTDYLSQLGVPAGARSVDASFGPFNEAQFGVASVEIHVFEIASGLAGTDAVQLRILLVVRTHHGYRVFIYGNPDDRLLLFPRSPSLTVQLDLPGGPTVPLIRLVVSWNPPEAGAVGELQIQKLIDVRPDFPRFCAIGNCFRKKECGDEHERLRQSKAAECRWDSREADFLCEIQDSRPFGWAWLTEHRWHFLLSNEQNHVRLSTSELRDEVMAFATQPMETALWEGRSRQVGRLGLIIAVLRVPVFSGRGTLGILAAPAVGCFFVVEREPPNRATLVETCPHGARLGESYGEENSVFTHFARPEEVRLSTTVGISARLLWKGRSNLSVYEVTETVASQPLGHRVSWLGIERNGRKLFVDRLQVSSDMPDGGHCTSLFFPQAAVGVDLLSSGTGFGADLDMEPGYSLQFQDDEHAGVVFGSRECPRKEHVRWRKGQGFISEVEERPSGCRGLVRRVHVSANGRLTFEEVHSRE